MLNVFVGASNAMTSLGFTTSEHVNQIKAGQIGISIYPGGDLYPSPVPLSLIDTQRLLDCFREHLSKNKPGVDPDRFTRSEMLHILSISNVLKNSGVDITDSRTLMILATLKGNMDLLKMGSLPAI